jgi:hypothetical protein
MSQLAMETIIGYKGGDGLGTPAAASLRIDLHFPVFDRN